MTTYQILQRCKKYGRVVVGEMAVSDTRTDRISLKGELQMWLGSQGIRLHECKRGLYVARPKA